MISDPKAKAKMVALAEFCYEQSQSEHDFFFEYSPFLNSVKIEAYAFGWEKTALNCVKIEAYAFGWEKTATPDYSKWISLDPYYHEETVEDITQKIINFLEVCK